MCPFEHFMEFVHNKFMTIATNKGAKEYIIMTFKICKKISV